MVGATGLVHAEHLYKVLDEYNSLSSLEAILLDNTSVNTGYKTGLVVQLEKMLGRKLHTIGCQLHKNELPFRAVFKSIDGTTRSPNHFCGPMGKLAEKNHDSLKVSSFEPVKSPVEDMEFSEQVLNDLSTDQRIFYEHIIGISKGNMSLRFAHHRIGPVNHARWLTLAIRLLSAYIHIDSPPDDLKYLVKYIQEVYGPCWFMQKKSNKLSESPGIMHFMIKQMKLQKSDITKTCFENLHYNAFCLLPENLLYAMLCDADHEVRARALNKIISIRKSGSPARINKIMDKNFEAENYWELIDIESPSIAEAGCTLKFSDVELHDMVQNQRKPDLAVFPCHSQSVEWAVKLVSEASACVYGQERRHQHICGKILSRTLRKSFASKGSYEENYDDCL